MAYAILAFDGNDPSRRAAAMDRHRAVISRWAADGRMPFGTPLFTAEWVPSGSLMILDVPDMAGVDAYLAEELTCSDSERSTSSSAPRRTLTLSEALAR